MVTKHMTMSINHPETVAVSSTKRELYVSEPLSSSFREATLFSANFGIFTT